MKEPRSDVVKVDVSGKYSGTQWDTGTGYLQAADLESRTDNSPAGNWDN